MSMLRVKHARFAVLCTILFILSLGTTVQSETIPDFCFLQISDCHLDPRPRGAAPPKASDRSVGTITWFCEQAAQPQQIISSGLETPAPSFVLLTGDITEYGVIYNTWDSVETLLSPLRMPVFMTPGNHDNTWTSMQHIMRRRYGGDHYSFDRFGCHFVSINTSTPQEPVPSIEQRTISFLEGDLKKVPETTPVFLFCHHPLSSREFADPFEQLRLLQTIENHNVVLLLMGHGHSARHERWGRLDSVMGGETFRANPGYNIISVIDGVLRVVYRYRDTARDQQVLLEKPIAMPRVPRVRLIRPHPLENGRETVEPLAGPVIPVSVRIDGEAPVEVSAILDDSKSNTIQLMPDNNRNNRRIHFFVGDVGTEGLIPGQHFLQIIARFDKLSVNRLLECSFRPSNDGANIARAQLASGVKAQPVFCGDKLIVVTTAGEVIHVLFRRGQPQMDILFESGTEILCAPAVVDDTLYFSSAETGLHAIGIDGVKHWKCDLNAVVYGTPAVSGERVYAADMEGCVHAVSRDTGKILWSRRHAQYSIEHGILWHDGVLYFGAWDGYLYAVDAHSGSLKWKRPGPAAHREEKKYKSRYYAPADCTPVILGDRLFVADRAYCLGAYSLEGTYIGEIASDVSAVSASRDGTNAYARGSSTGLARYDQKGELIWSNPVSLGRFPIPPTVSDNRVYVCSNRGRLTAHDADDGQTLWQYQVTPQLHVMAPVVADDVMGVYVAGMDGTITHVQPASP